MASSQLRTLQQLARLYGVQTAYYDVARRRRHASPESLLAALRLLGAPIETLNDVSAALRERRQTLWQRCVEPVVVIWDQGHATLDLHLPADHVRGTMRCERRDETGEVHHYTMALPQLPTVHTLAIEGSSYVLKRLTLPGTVPWGYHQLSLEAGNRWFETRIISAPRHAYAAPAAPTRREWGVFLPLYALHSQCSWGSGDFTELEALALWIANQGGSVLATLPMLTAYFDEPFDPSPYVPASRLFWNELYIDIARVPELQRCPATQTLLASTVVQEELAALRAAPRVAYRRQWTLKRHVLEKLAHCFLDAPSTRQEDFERFVRTHPAVDDYARFRATGERLQTPWSAWPARLRHGVLTAADYAESARHYHLYVQWLAQQQLTAVTARAETAGVRLYLDLPLGVHAHSYDVWRERDIFALGATVGAPPDTFFSQGQNWGFPPLHPEAMRLQGYRYHIAFLRHQLTHAGLLRLDHVMALHRLFWIPQGLEAQQGVYVRYAAEELYALVCLESHRHRTTIVGENLGTVPSYVNTAMRRHHLHRMYVLQYALRPDYRMALQMPSSRAVAGFNTHDMPTFAAFWAGLDIAERTDLGLLEAAEAQYEQQQRAVLKGALVDFLRRHGWLQGRSTEAQTVFKACVAYLAASPAQTVLLNLEDLWLETRPHNVPGTHTERPNWLRKARYSRETFCHMPQVLELLRTLNAGRQRVTGHRRYRQQFDTNRTNRDYDAARLS